MGKQCQTFFFFGLQVTADGDCSHEIKRCLLPGRKAMTNLDSILKSKDNTLPTKVHLVKAMAFPLVMYGMDYRNIEWFALEMNRDHSVTFEIASKYCISDSC